MKIIFQPPLWRKHTYFDKQEAQTHNIAFAKAGQDNVTSTKATWQQWFGLDFYYLAFVLNLYFTFSI